MKRLLFAAAIFVSALATRAADEGYTALLDAKHTEGWEHIGEGSMQVEDGVAVTMGSETIEQKHGPQAGEVINRRFTNVWLFRDGKWWLRFRHANVAPNRPQVLTSDDA